MKLTTAQIKALRMAARDGSVSSVGNAHDERITSRTIDALIEAGLLVGGHDVQEWRGRCGFSSKPGIKSAMIGYSYGSLTDAGRVALAEVSS